MDFSEANISDFVYCIISFISNFRRKTGHNVRLAQEKRIISTGNETGGREEFLVINGISVTEKRAVLFMEGKKRSTGGHETVSLSDERLLG